MGRKVFILQADSGHRKDNERVFDYIRNEHGRVDVLVANGGAGFFGSTLGVTDQQWRWTIDSNANRACLCKLNWPLRLWQSTLLPGASLPLYHLVLRELC